MAATTTADSRRHDRVTRTSRRSCCIEPRRSRHGILDESGWYYIRSRYRNFAFYAPDEIDRQVLAISFDQDGVVSNIERFGLERGRVVRLSRRVTTSNTEGIGLLRQAFGNLGNFNPADFFDDDDPS